MADHVVALIKYRLVERKLKTGEHVWPRVLLPGGHDPIRHTGEVTGKMSCS